MSARIASSSRPSASTSSGVRWVYSLMSLVAMSDLLDVECAVAGSGGNSGLNSVALAVFVSVADVANVSRFEREHAALADPHPAPERHLDAHLLTGFQQRGGAVDLDRLVGAREGDGAALAALVGSRDDEALHVEVVLLHACVGPHLLEGVQHRGRTTRPGGSVLPV